MNKNKITALGLATIAFVAFYWGFMDFESGSRFVNLFAFVIVLFSTVSALFVGNAGDR